ncbi:MAG TPA: DoxX family protein [Chryseosolibacter sp.]|nr:DoxX family protein [Chryseosolibacter sp.]
MKTVLLWPGVYWNDAIVLLRVWIGIIFISHGLSIWSPENMRSFTNYLTTLNVPFPLVNAYLCKSTEFIGGILLVLGLFKRAACIFLIIDMMVATFVAGRGELLQEGRTPFIMLICCITFLLSPTEKPSLDWIIFKRTIK